MKTTTLSAALWATLICAAAGLGPGISIARAALGDQLAKLTASDAAEEDYFGRSAAISGNTALVGAYYSAGASGSAYLFDVTTGNQLAKLTASDAGLVDDFGSSVAISGNTALVGAHNNDDDGENSGSAYLFDVSDPLNPVELAKLTASDAAAFDYFGLSVAISGNAALVGARGDDAAGSSSGSAYLFDVSDPLNPVELAKLTTSDAAAADHFGYSVAISGNTAVLGAYADDDGWRSGSAYLFDVSDPLNPVELAKLTASDAAADDQFGCSVAISGNAALVGAPYDDDDGNWSGSAYLFSTVPEPGTLGLILSGLVAIVVLWRRR